MEEEEGGRDGGDALCDIGTPLSSSRSGHPAAAASEDCQPLLVPTGEEAACSLAHRPPGDAAGGVDETTELVVVVRTAQPAREGSDLGDAVPLANEDGPRPLPALATRASSPPFLLGGRGGAGYWGGVSGGGGGSF